LKGIWTRLVIAVSVLAFVVAIVLILHEGFTRYDQPSDVRASLPEGAQFLMYDPHTNYRLYKLGGCIVTDAYEYHEWHLSYNKPVVCPAS
jgi:hypothetical protein